MSKKDEKIVNTIAMEKLEFKILINTSNVEDEEHYQEVILDKTELETFRYILCGVLNKTFNTGAAWYKPIQQGKEDK